MRGLLPLLALLLGACGFRLLGDRPLPEGLQRVHIDVIAPYEVMEPAVETHLRTLLLRRGSDVVRRPGPGITEVRLSELETLRTILSIGADGKALEFSLTTRLKLELRRDGQVLIPPTPLEVERDFSFNAQQVLAKEAEEARLRRYLQTELAELILLRLEAVLSQPRPATAVPAAPAGG